MKNRLSNAIIIPIVAVLFAILCLFAFLLKTNNADFDGATVIIKKGTHTIEEVNTDLLENSYEVDLGTNRIRIDKDGVSMIYASCPDKLCVNQGKINKKGQSVICLPNKIIIEIAGGKTSVDAVAGAR